jgi:hypothetical protein
MAIESLAGNVSFNASSSSHSYALARLEEIFADFSG